MQTLVYLLTCSNLGAGHPEDQMPFYPTVRKAVDTCYSVESIHEKHHQSKKAWSTLQFLHSRLPRATISPEYFIYPQE